MNSTNRKPSQNRKPFNFSNCKFGPQRAGLTKEDYDIIFGRCEQNITRQLMWANEASGTQDSMDDQVLMVELTAGA